MYALDFEYDNLYLSSFGFIVCNFNFSDGADEVTTGSTITFNKVPRNSGKINSLSGTQYDECITSTFDICKNPDIYDLDKREISNEEYREIVRWLNRREFLRFCVLSDSESEQEVCYFQASFNVTQIKIGERVFGIRLVMETDKPFGYGSEKTIIWNFSTGNSLKTLTDMSDEIGYIYPNISIKCKQSGDLTIHNDFMDCNTHIKNCQNGEIITLYGDSQIITSSLSSHDVCNDFNYDFFKIGNTYASRINRITASLPCEITIKYSPVIKDIF